MSADAVNTEVEVEDEDEVPTPIDFLDSIEGDKVDDVVEILAGLDPMDPQYNSSKRDIIMEARRVWKATGL